jgi:hypothetical protein
MPGAVAKAGLASLIATPARIGEAIMAHASAQPLLRQGGGGG